MKHKLNCLLLIFLSLLLSVQFSYTSFAADTDINEGVFDILGSEDELEEHETGMYKITYELNGGINNPQNPATYNYGDGFYLKDPSKQGYSFDGWYKTYKKKKFKNRIMYFDAKTKEGITLYAKWKKTTYKIVYNLNGGKNTKKSKKNKKSYNIATKSFSLGAPKKSGYTFGGWYDMKSNKYDTIEKGSTGDLVLSASWISETGEEIKGVPYLRLADGRRVYDEGTISPEEYKTATLVLDLPPCQWSWVQFIGGAPIHQQRANWAYTYTANGGDEILLYDTSDPYCPYRELGNHNPDYLILHFCPKGKHQDFGINIKLLDADENGIVYSY